MEKNFDNSSTISSRNTVS